MTVKPSKPFNPILGETYEGFMSLDFQNLNNLEDNNVKDVYRIYAEQISHHPPISNLLIQSDIVTITANFELSG
jgi:hypothetical protein